MGLSQRNTKDSIVRELDSNFRARLKTLILEELFRFNIVSLDKAKADLVQSNNILLNREYEGVRYRNHSFAFVDYPDTWKVKANLDPSLHQRADDLIEETKIMNDEHRVVESFLKRLSNRAKNVDDVFALCPEELWRYFPKGLLEHKDKTECSLSNTNITNFITVNSHAHAIIKERIILKLILR
jgi:hypothetical protein